MTTIKERSKLSENKARSSKEVATNSLDNSESVLIGNGIAPPLNTEQTPKAKALRLWATSDEALFLLCIVNADRASSALDDLSIEHFPSERAQQIFQVAQKMRADNEQIIPDFLAQRLEDCGFEEAAEIVRTDLATIVKKPPKSWTDEAYKIAEVLIENGPILFSTDNELDEALGEIEWLWHGYIPRGFVTGIVGEQDAGKSTVTQDLTRTLLLGGRWPDGQIADKLPHNQQLLWIDTDGNIALFHQKLKAWKMPRGRFVFPRDPLQELNIDNPKDWRWIEAVIEKYCPPLVVIDALSGSHGGKENDTDSMKSVMKRLHALAQKHKIAIAVIHHLNKAPFGVPAYPLTTDRLRGSSSISQFCRSILALTVPDPTQPDQRRLDVIKLNVAKKPPAVGYILTNEGPAWGNAPEPPKPRRAVDDAIDFLQGALAGGLRPSAEVEDEAKARNIGDNALKDARKALGVKAHKQADGKWFLTMPTSKKED